MKVKVVQLSPTLCDPMDYTVHGILQARTLEWVAFPFSRGSSQSRSPALQVDSLPAEQQGKAKNTGVGSLSLLQWIFPTQDSTWVSCIAGGFFNWAMTEGHLESYGFKENKSLGHRHHWNEKDKSVRNW